jgi:hypothetical protein
VHLVGNNEDLKVSWVGMGPSIPIHTNTSCEACVGKHYYVTCTWIVKANDALTVRIDDREKSGFNVHASEQITKKVLSSLLNI